MAPPVENHSVDRRRKAAPLHSQPPFRMQLPDVTPAKKLQPTSAPTAGLRQKADDPTPAHDPVAHARARLHKKRYDDGHQQVTSILDRLRDRRRKLFGRLWMASVLITALSIVILAVELIQGMNFTTAAVETVPSTGETDATRPVVRKSSTRSQRSIVRTEARVLSNELPGAAAGEKSVKSALYTTEGNRRPKGVWLDGTITDNDDPDEPTR